MTFDEILEQVITLLKRQGRVSYPALKIRFSLDDAYLEALKAEIIEAQQLATDENGRVLVWAGKTEETSVAASPPAQLTLQPAVQAAQPPDEPLPTALSPPDAERRQLTVLFCDVVDSTKLSSQLDPEVYREVVRTYQATCTEVIHRYDGHIAQLLGDGLLVYCGFPQAHEDDPQRAVRTGLEIIGAVRALSIRLEQDKGITLAVRLGIHTGLVVVGDMGQGRQEQLALGETPNIAARIQGHAAPDSVVISDATYRLVQGYFEFQELGEQHLRGVSQPVPIYQVLQESGVQSRLDVASTRGLTPLVGRESEVTILLERWEQAKNGHGQVVLLSGEGGIGKSRLVQVLKEHVANEPHNRWECRSSPYYQNTALYPLIDLLQRALQWRQDDAPEQRLEKLEHLLRQYRLPLEESVPLFAPLLSLSVPEERYPLLNFSPQRQRQKTLESIVAILLELAEREPVLFILEDLHWTDPTTLEFLGLLVEQVPTAAIYTLLTCRPHFQPSWHHRSYLTEITVNRLSRDQIERMAERVAGGKKLPEQVLQQIVEKTDGVPLFVEEMTKAILESGHLKEVDEHYELTGMLPAMAIPATLQDSLMARLDQLVTAKGVAQYASVIGRQFSYELLQAVSQFDEATLQRELNRLVEAELIYQRGLPPQAIYTFKHALIQNTAYESLLRSTRQGYHRRIAEVLTERFPETTENQPELLAYHYTEASLNEQAVNYWYKAGQQAAQRSAYVETIAHLKQGLELLKALPDTPERIRQELTMQTTLGPALVATQGYAVPEVGHAYARARELCQQIGETPQLFSVLRGLLYFYHARAEFQTARELAEQCLRLAQGIQDSGLLLEAHRGLGCVLFHLGVLIPAQEHLTRAVALYAPEHHRVHATVYGIDPGTCLVYVNWTWYLGFPDQALQRCHEALAFIQESSHPLSQALALIYAAWLHHLRRDGQATYEYAEAAIILCREQGFPQWLALGTVFRGLALTTQDQMETGLTQIRQGLAAWRVTGAELCVPYWLALLVEIYDKTRQPEEGLTLLSDGFTLVEKNDERWCEAELHRLKGQLLLQQSSDNTTEAESCFHQAIAIAQNQSAKSWELRAATSLARLWQCQGKRQDAYDLLAPVYTWFTEGFDTADLQDAKALLEALQVPRSASAGGSP